MTSRQDEMPVAEAGDRKSRSTDAVRLDRSSYQQGREEERAAVLAYLGALRPYPGGAYADAFAKAIEDGEHLEPPGSSGASSG